ncbi:metal ABC transporter ATP-binding protein [Candidatus Nitrosocosmicus franklandus]|uniref:High-affinity zinc uptake system ATP-binding protein ZnuC n=1 Tax=Candidatus Nitrosocosmicus franklandianus TaxID=1798806 RepID=A0A484IAL0_9ARCH|nr:metal ABC transporter ATP-binding protein [Candidatus Nitrosocosmicus franklandus]VFJ13803.1 High-affinity zinc uptake system ATP-binding protein ZnuC [Candidatus Nitrosocosmicus franklandus]
MGSFECLRITGLSYGFSYHDFVIEGVNLTIPKGRFVSIVGPSGSGKTTLLKLLCGIYEPWNGDIEYICNNDRDSIFYHPSIGYVPQIETIDWNFPVSVQEVIAMGSWNYKSYLPWIDKKLKNQIKDVLRILGLGGYEKRHIRALSGGEQQRVFLGRALIRNPDVLILDEPTTGLDYVSREKIFDILKNLNNNGMTVILSTHDITHIANRSPWVVCFNKYVIAEGPPQDVLKEENLLKTYGLADYRP